MNDWGSQRVRVAGSMRDDQEEGALGLDATLFVLRDGEELVFDPGRRLRILMLRLFGYAHAASVHLGNLELAFDGSALAQLGDGMSLSGPGFSVVLLPGEKVRVCLPPTDPAKPPYMTIQTAAEVEEVE